MAEGAGVTTPWTSCYSEGWGDRIVPDAFSHPAKMSYNLLVRILAHAKEEGWVTKDSVVLDPFGGIGTTGIVGAYQGYRVVCVELEPKFVDLGLKNFELHRRNWETLGVPFPVIIQGDSRKLSEVLQGADCVVSSPPYAESATAKNSSGIDKSKQWETYRSQGGGLSYEAFVEQQERHSLGYGSSPGQLGAMKAGDLIISSPPFQESGMDIVTSGKTAHMVVRNSPTKGGKREYGESPGQLGSMPPGDLIVSSPPFMENNVNIGGVGNTPGLRQQIHDSTKRDNSYGVTPGQLGQMKAGDLIVSSPPYEGSMTTPNKENDLCPHDSTKRYERQYSTERDNLGNSQGETFWTAARQIVSECHKILKPGGHAVWIVKAFVRNKKIVDFPGDWQRLCEDVGFKTVCVHHAMLVKSHKVGHLFDGEVTKKTERKSFFRRLAESKGSPRIDFETVLCQEK